MDMETRSEQTPKTTEVVVDLAEYRRRRDASKDLARTRESLDRLLRHAESLGW